MALVAVSILGLAALLGLALDTGHLQQQKRAEQTAADAAALAGAIEYFRERPGAVTASALSEAARNDFPDGVNGVSVQVTTPVTTGDFVGPTFVRVDIQKDVNSIFSGVVGRSSVLVHSFAIAGISYASNCLVVLDPTSSGSLNLANSATLTAIQCSLVVNSSHPTALSMTGQNVVTATAVGVVGGWDGDGQILTPSGAVALHTGAAPALDPLALATMPAVPNTCNYTNKQVTGVETLSPGTYCGGLTVKQAGANATLLPGTYFLRGGGLTVFANATLASSGTGVTFINTADPVTGNYGVFNMQANSTLNLKADTDPATTALPGVLFWQDRAAPFAVNVFKAGSGSTIKGTFYFPTTQVALSSGSTQVIDGALVAWQLTITQNTDITFTGITGGADYYAVRKPTIVQ